MFGIAADSVTAGFRIYAEPKRKLSSIAVDRPSRASRKIRNG